MIKAQKPGSVKHRSFWLQQVAGDAPDEPPLRGDQRADVAIIGGGYVGLWTALRIKEMDAGCDVVVLEQDICGGGASGRNGGFVLSLWPKLASLAKICGEQEALRVARDSVEAIDFMRDFCEMYHIDANFRRGGWLWTATSQAQMGSWGSVVRLCDRLGVDAFQLLSPQEVARRSGSPAHRAGVFEASAATVQPAALVRGMRRVALQRGVRIYEGTRVQAFTRSHPVVVRSEAGVLTADKLVIASNAWAAGIRELSQTIVAVTSDMVMTAPIPDELRRLGWVGGECISDSLMMVDYYHATHEGRVAFGKGGWGIAYGGNIGVDFDRNERRARHVIDHLLRYYPSLRQVPVTHDWCGPIDRTPNSLPVLGRLGRRDYILYGIGWSGNGVGPSVIGGRILASLALERDDGWSRYPLVEWSGRRFPPEPIRFIGAHIVRNAVVQKERAESSDQKPPYLAVKLSKLAPSGIEDK